MVLRLGSIQACLEGIFDYIWPVIIEHSQRRLNEQTLK